MGSPSNGHRRLPADEARELIGRGIAVVPIPHGQKNPVLKDWKNYTLDVADVERVFPPHSNVGMILGERSGGLADADLDAPEAVRAAAFYLPRTDMIWGRDGKPRSHFGYVLESTDGAREIKLKDANGAMLCELRYTGQTIAPGSTNTADGYDDRVRYEPDGHGPPSAVAFGDLKRALERIAATAMIARLWTKGGRHALVLPLAGLFWYGGVPLEDAVRFVEVVCSVCGETEQETIDRLTVVRGTYENAQAGTFVTGGTTLEGEVGTKVVDNLRKWLDIKKPTSMRINGPDGLPLASDGDGDRFVALFGDKTIYCAVEKQWYIWSGSYWKPDRKEYVQELAKQVADRFRGDVGELLKTNPRGFGSNGIGEVRDCVEWAMRMGNSGRIRAMLEAARSRPQIAVVPEQLDANPSHFNVANCTLDLDVKTGRVGSHTHRPEDYITMTSPVTYDPSATSELLGEYREMFYPEADRWSFLFDMAAEAMTGHPKRHSLNLIGPTNAGKSMTLSLFGNLFGDYASTLQYTSLVRDQRAGGDRPRGDLWHRRRKRLVAISEMPNDVTFDTALYKALLGGGDKMAIRNLNDISGGADVKWAVSLWFSGNKDYGPPPGEEAAYERLLPLRCEHQVPKEKRDQSRQLRILDVGTTGPALLNLVLAGFERLYGQNHGNIEAPDVVLKERADLRARKDPYSDIVERLFEFTGDPDDAVLVTEAWEAAKGLRLDELGVDRLDKQLKERGAFEDSMSRGEKTRVVQSTVRWNNARSWRGVRWTKFAQTYQRITLPDWK